MFYVIKRTDQGGGYVSKPGRSSSYTNTVKNMQKFPTEEAASKTCCENEIPVPIEHVID